MCSVWTQLGTDQPSTIRFQDVPALVGLGCLPGAIRVATRTGKTTVHTHDVQTTLRALLEQAAQCDVRLPDLDAHNASPESVFLAIASGDSDPDEPASQRKEQPGAAS